MDLKNSKQFLARFNDYTARFDHLKKPDWFENRVLGMKAAIMHPDFTSDIATLMLCDKESVLKHYIILRAYLCYDYGFEPDVIESFILFATSRNFDDLSPMRQVDGISVVDFKNKEMHPSENPKEVFDEYINKYNKISPHIYLRLGRSVSRKDVQWFLDEYWDRYIDNKINTLPPLKYERVPKTLPRDATIYAMHKSGMKSSEIVDSIHKQFGGKVLEYTYIYKVKKSFKPEHEYFKLINKQIKSYSDNHSSRPLLNFDKDKKDVFYLTNN